MITSHKKCKEKHNKKAQLTTIQVAIVPQSPWWEEGVGGREGSPRPLERWRLVGLSPRFPTTTQVGLRQAANFATKVLGNKNVQIKVQMQ